MSKNYNKALHNLNNFSHEESSSGHDQNFAAVN